MARVRANPSLRGRPVDRSGAWARSLLNRLAAIAIRQIEAIFAKGKGIVALVNKSSGVFKRLLGRNHPARSPARWRAASLLLVSIALGGALELRATDNGTAPEAKAPAASTNLVDQLETLLKRGTASSVVLSFVQNWSQPYLTSSEDIRKLTSAGASSDVVQAYSRRGAELRLLASRSADRDGSTNGPQIILIPILRPSAISSSPGPENPYLFSDLLQVRAQQYEFGVDGPWYAWGPWGPWWGPFAGPWTWHYRHR